MHGQHLLGIIINFQLFHTNLINNIGFGPDATWTIRSKNPIFKKPKNLKYKYFKKEKN